MSADLLLPASNYLFNLPSVDPSGAGVLRRVGETVTHEKRVLEAWSPTFVLFYAEAAELKLASQELVKVNGRLLGEYTFTPYQQMVFTFQRGAKEGLDLLGGLTLDISNLPVGVMHHNPWGLALVPEGGDFPQDVAAFCAGARLLEFTGAGPDDVEGTEYVFGEDARSEDADDEDTDED